MCDGRVLAGAVTRAGIAAKPSRCHASACPVKVPNHGAYPVFVVLTQKQARCELLQLRLVAAPSPPELQLKLSAALLSLCQEARQLKLRKHYS